MEALTYLVGAVIGGLIAAGIIWPISIWLGNRWGKQLAEARCGPVKRDGKEPTP